eukprot:NODE_282_length_1695_cov_100.322600_g208_i0.p1 GENE.NODE_282_length_1695_cov_100.322600_g208_i0~~NODE_282_length_1695_cov_100.322600_g208_i0.p1  ORF type:complete len:532 (+),score=185.04 NODE_282_length_1695_cov_100.322600_g208_i0:29-1597(+)
MGSFRFESAMALRLLTVTRQLGLRRLFYQQASSSQPREATLYEQYVNGQFVRSHGAPATIDVENPTTQEIIARTYCGDVRDARDALEAAHTAQPKWASTSPAERARALHQMADVIRKNRIHLAKTLSDEQAKVMGLAQVEVDFTADYFDYNAEWSRRVEGEVIPSDRKDEQIILRKEPVGVVVGICPWNFPLFVAARKIAPPLAVGCTVIIKPSRDTPCATMEFAKLVHEAGILPPGVLNFLCGIGSVFGEPLCTDSRVGIISLTGSVDAGVQMMKFAAKSVTKVSLELGGKAPAIVCADCDVDATVKNIVASCLTFGGQICNCAERLYVDEKIAPVFIPKLVEAFKQVKFGPPDQDVMYCSQIHGRHLDDIDDMVKRAVAAGAKVECGGKRSTLYPTGYYYEPTILTNVDQKSEIIQDEVFGPVLPIKTFRTFDEAIAMANDSQFGLTSSVHTNSHNLAQRAINELHFGEVYVNREHFEAMQGFHAGWRRSGIGGADGKHGMEEYVQTKVVYVAHDSSKNH